MRILLLTPPMTQLNTPYPATAYLTGFLRQQGYDAVQGDPALELVLKMFSREGLTSFAPHFSAQEISTVDAAVRFLQGKDPTLALRIVSRQFLPEGPRFAAAEGDALPWAFGHLGIQDQARFLATLFLDDLADRIRDRVDARFGLSRYGEKLAASATSFNPLQEALHGSPTPVDQMLDDLTVDWIRREKPDVVAMTAPFPGNVYGAFRMARTFRKHSPRTKLVLGGGYVNTELRELSESRVFDYFDAICLDDGERPLECLLEYWQGKRPESELLRTWLGGKWISSAREHDVPQIKAGTPTYEGLPLSEYLSVFEMLNPMHRIWSDGRWNKLTLAHGCYWKKCNFCDTSLDYIGRYDASPTEVLLSRIESLVRETGQTGFHFVDEAAPPAALRALALGLIERQKKGLHITWWGNIRFEKTFTPELCALLAQSGCVAVSGGLEVASDRLLKLMNKGVTVEQVARVTHAFAEAGVMVHAYLMYGFPSQSAQETVDALERVRQLFAAGCIQSAFWHQFSVTVHSPIGRDPKRFGIRLLPLPQPKTQGTFAKNDLLFEDPRGADPERFGPALKRALYNYMHGNGLDADVRTWFREAGWARPPRAEVPRDLVLRALSESRTGGAGEPVLPARTRRARRKRSSASSLRNPSGKRSRRG